MNKKKNSLLIILINFFFVIVAVLILFNFFPKNFFQKKSETFNPSLERIEIAIPAKGFVVKQEVLYYAPVSGKVKRIKQAPDLLAKNDEAIQIINIDNKSVLSIKTKDEGFITYIKDDCEKIYSLEAIQKRVLTEDEIINIPVKQVKVTDDQIVEKDDFIFKIVKNNVIYFYLSFDTKDIEKFQIGDSLVFTINDPQNISTDGKIVSKTILNEKKTLLVYETSFYIEPLINHRKISGSFTFPYVTACYVPSKAISIQKDPKGNDKYYILVRKQDNNKISSVLTEVKVIGQNSYTKEYIVDKLSENLEIFRDFETSQKKYINSGK